MAAGVVTGVTVAHASPQHLDVKVLLIGQPAPDPTTEAWQAQLTSEGVPYTLVLADGSAPDQTVSLPDLVDPDDPNHGLFDGVVITGSRYNFVWGQLSQVWNYESTFGVRQIDGYVFPDSALGLDFVEGGDLSGTTANLTAAGLATFPTLTGPVPFDVGTFGYVSTAGASMTPLLDDSSGRVLMGIFQHPDPDWSTLQSGVAELVITFNYNSNSSHWLMLAPGLIDWVTNGAFAPHPQTLDLKVLLIGQPGGDPTTQAWQAQLTREGVPYTLVLASGSPGSLTVSLPDLVDPGDANHGLFDGVVITTSRYDFAWPQLLPVWNYESTFGVRQVDGYVYPGSFVGLNPVSSGDLSGTTPTLSADGLGTFPALKGPVPFDVGTFGYMSTVDPSLPAGASTTPLLKDVSGNVLMDIYQHAVVADPYLQPGVAELAITFDYGPTFLQWLILAPGLIDWVTKGAHLGLFRNYFGQDVDDVLLPDNSWSSTDHCTPGATNPPDITCPPGVDIPPDQQMTAADVDHVVQWEHQTGITLELAFNGVGGTNPDDPTFVSELLAKQADFNWVNHTWSHQFLGCIQFQAMPVSTIDANTGGGSLEAGTDTYEVTALTAFGESEPSAPQVVTVDDGDTVSLTWPDAPNAGGPLLWQLEAEFGGGTGSWGYKIYRQLGDGTYGLVGVVPEDTSGGTTTYSFTDTGAVSPGAGPSSTSAYPTATNPAILCDAWDPASAIQAEFDQNITFAVAHGLSHFDPSVVVTGEHSGVENPNLPTAMSASGIATFRTDASRQPNQYSIVGPALSAPSYPSNIYYNTSDWADEIDEYNTLYLEGAPNGHCVNTPTNTCITTPATETSILASESRIELRHILGNDPRVGFAHQMNLIGPANSGYTLLTFLDDVLAQYHAWFKVPLQQMTVSTEAQVLSRQSGWQAALAASDVVASQSGDTMTVTNNGADPVTVPVSAPLGSVVDGISLGERYGASVSSWRTLQPGASLTVMVGSGSAPAFTSVASTTFTIGRPGSFTVTTSGIPTPSLAESGVLPAGVTFTDDGDGTATLAGTPGGAGGTYPVTLIADNGVGSEVHQSFSLSVNVTPHVVWRKLKAIVFGTPLSAVQLDATASVPGTFTYSPASGAVLPVGTSTLTATFTPTDTVAYATTTVHNSLQVKKAASSTSVVFVSPIAVGHEELAHFVVTVDSSNGVIPSGTVAIKAGRSTVCTASLDAFGVATCTLSPSKLKAGGYTVTAKYSGSPSFNASKSAAATLIVTP